MLLPDVLIEEVEVAVAAVARVAHVLLGHVVLHVKEELLGGEFGGGAVAALVQVALVVALLSVREASVLVLYPGPEAERTHLADRLVVFVELSVTQHVLVEGASSFNVVQTEKEKLLVL